MDTIRTYEPDRAAIHPFGFDESEMAVRIAEAVELLRCVADTGDEHSDLSCKTIEAVSLELDCSLFVTLLARLWAQHVMSMRQSHFENDRAIVLEAALQLEPVEQVIEEAGSPRPPPQSIR